MATKITMPKLGLTMNSGSVREWKKNIGEHVKKGELLFSVATDKLTVDVESPADGIFLKTTVEIAQDVPVGETIGFIGEAGETIEAFPAAASPALEENKAEIQRTKEDLVRVSSGERVSASPKAKKIARDNGIDISTLKGTGPNGWIVAEDVQAAINGVSKTKVSPVAAKIADELGVNLSDISCAGRIMKRDVFSARKGGIVRIPISPMRRVIGERMLQSVKTAPAVSYFIEADMTAINEMRAKCNKNIEGKGVKISLNDIFMKLCAKVLMDNPMANAYVEQDTFVLHDYVNIGLAVSVPNGLIVPNVKNVQDKSLLEVAQERAALVEKARSGSISMKDMSDGTFTISNLGMMGVSAFTPIINPPEAAILGIGATVEKTVVENGAIKIKPMATLCLTADHRLVDGADGAKIISEVKMLVENPELFML